MRWPAEALRERAIGRRPKRARAGQGPSKTIMGPQQKARPQRDRHRLFMGQIREVF